MIPSESWQARHRSTLVFLVAHAPLLYFLRDFIGSEPYVTGATFTAAPTEHILLGVGAAVGLALLVWLPWPPRRIRSDFVSIGLLTCSALLVYSSGGYIEAHLHFSVIVAVFTVHEDWFPFIAGILYIAIRHDIFGMNHPEAMYNYPDAIANPIGWGLTHAVFILMFASTLVMN